MRRCAALVCDDKKSSFETIHGLIDHVLCKLNCRSVEDDVLNTAEKEKNAAFEA